MKPIKITSDNAAAIEAALLAANGRAHLHAYTEYREIASVARNAEDKLIKLVGKTHAAGARYTDTSGVPVSKSYAKKAFHRAATTVMLERRATGWYLTRVSANTVGKDGGGPGELTLTPAQAEHAVAIFKRQFSTKAA